MPVLSEPRRVVVAAIYALSISLLFSLSTALAAERGQLPDLMAEKLRLYGIPVSAVSVYVGSVDGESGLLEVNESVPRNPASVIKLLTALIALDTLGPGYVWRTEAYADGDIEMGLLKGNLILKGYGDPYLTPEAFWSFVRGLRERGLREIEGDVVVDNSFFELPDDERGDFDGEPHRVYNALPYALSLGLQATRLHLFPDEAAGRVRVYSDPPLANLKINNGLKLVRKPCHKRYHSPEVRIQESKSGATVKLGGDFSSRCREFSVAKLVMDPAVHVGGAFTSLWREMGGRFNGRVRSGPVPAKARLLHAMESKPLGEVIRAMNKHSSNLMSRLLLLTVAADEFGEPGSVANGRLAADKWLQMLGLSIPELVLDNGSGLSRDARISAASLGRLLTTAYQSPHMPEFMASLAVAGVDGTMRKRFVGEPLAGRAHIKTGSLNDVSTMAGYVLDRHGERRVVVLMINHKGMPHWQGKQIQNRLLWWVYSGAKEQIRSAHLKDADPRGDCVASDQASQAAASSGNWRANPAAGGEAGKAASLIVDHNSRKGS